MDLSLSRIQRLLRVLPPYTRPTVHIAGTNGKGSVTSIIDHVLREAGFSTGRFNSPHLVTPRDCIMIDGRPIDESAFIRARAACIQASADIVDEPSFGHPTEFEVLTATALYAFEQTRPNLDVVILEVGMGGRLDATNAIPESTVIACGISAVDLDHQAFLGDTVEEIAREKAGIAKKGVTCVVGDQSHDAVYNVIKEAVTEANGRFLRSSELVQVAPTIPQAPPPSTYPPPPAEITVQLRGEAEFTAYLPLLGQHQLKNLALATAIIGVVRENPQFSGISSKHIASGIQNTRWPGRLEWLSYNLPREGEEKRPIAILADGAHNPASASALTAYLDSLTGLQPRDFIVSLSSSPRKEPKDTLSHLLRRGDRVVVVPFSNVEGMPWVKPVDSSVVAKISSGIVGTEGFAAVSPSLEDALASYDRSTSFTVVAGSLYLIGDLYRLLGKGTSE